MSVALAPLPPDDLLIRTGVDPSFSAEERISRFESVGFGAYEDILSAVTEMPKPISALDFGCGAGRIMRWFLRHEDIALAGCDIHAPTIEWMRSAYPEDVRLYVNDPRPPLPEPDATFDLVYCGSVFSHLPDWAPWLLELRRVLRPGGALVASIHGRGSWPIGVAGSRGAPWEEERTGLLVERFGADFVSGWGPAVYVSEWWLREHWGRAFEIERFEPAGFGHSEDRYGGQAWVVARKRDSVDAITAEDLRRADEDPRELAAALRAQWLAYEEIRGVEAELAEARVELGQVKADGRA